MNADLLKVGWQPAPPSCPAILITALSDRAVAVPAGCRARVLLLAHLDTAAGNAAAVQPVLPPALAAACAPVLGSLAAATVGVSGPDVDSLGVGDLRRVCAAAGVSVDGLVEKSELRAREALQRPAAGSSGAASSAAPSSGGASWLPLPSHSGGLSAESAYATLSAAADFLHAAALASEAVVLLVPTLGAAAPSAGASHRVSAPSAEAQWGHAICAACAVRWRGVPSKEALEAGGAAVVWPELRAHALRCARRSPAKST